MWSEKSCADSLSVEHERKRWVEGDFKVMGLNNGKNWVVIYFNEEDWEECSLGGRSVAQPTGSVKLEMPITHLRGDVKMISVIQVWSSMMVVGAYGLKINKVKVLIVNTVVMEAWKWNVITRDMSKETWDLKIESHGTPTLKNLGKWGETKKEAIKEQPKKQKGKPRERCIETQLSSSRVLNFVRYYWWGQWGKELESTVGFSNGSCWWLKSASFLGRVAGTKVAWSGFVR